MRSGGAWVKLALPFKLAERPAADAQAFADALIEANPARCLFALGWPHVAAQAKPPVPDDAILLSLLAAWAPDAAVRRRILVDNPAALYRF